MVGLRALRDVDVDPVASLESGAGSVASPEARTAFAAAQEGRSPFERLPVEIVGLILDRLGPELWLARQVTFGLRLLADKLFQKRRQKIGQPFIDKINIAIHVPVGHVPGSRQVSAALTVAGAIRENLDGLTGPERDKLVAFVEGLSDWNFYIALRVLGSGVQHFSVEQQNRLLDRAEQISRRGDLQSFPDTDSVHSAMMRLVPYLSDGPRQRAFNFSLVVHPAPFSFLVAQAQPRQRQFALRVVAGRSHLMLKSELDAAVDMVTDPMTPFTHATPTGQPQSRLWGRARGYPVNTGTASSRPRRRLRKTSITSKHP